MSVLRFCVDSSGPVLPALISPPGSVVWAAEDVDGAGGFLAEVLEQRAQQPENRVVGATSQRWLRRLEIGCIVQASLSVECGSKYLEENGRQVLPSWRMESLT